jgi:hypothetical protein
MSAKTYTISALTRIYKANNSDNYKLSMAEVTAYDDLGSFSDLKNYVMSLQYASPQTNKLETFGWVPALYMPSEQTFRRSDGSSVVRKGCWRNGAAEGDELSVFYADVDNANPDMQIVTMGDVANRLDGLCGTTPFFMYSSFSNTLEKPKFRVVIDIDRDISRTEMLRMAIYLNALVFGDQADLSIYDPGDFVFAPPYQAIDLSQLQGIPIGVDKLLEAQASLQASTPNILKSYMATMQPKRPTLRTTRIHDTALKDMTIRPDTTILNPNVFNPAWSDFYPQCGNEGHWQTMRSVLGMVWAKNSGDLTYGELDAILREIDATDGDYFTQKYGETGISDLLSWLISTPVSPRVQEWHSILENEETDLTIFTKEAECGEGKTHAELSRIASGKGRYVYAVQKIADIELRRKEFTEIAGPLVALRFKIREAHSKNDGLQVPLQLLKIRSELDRLPAGQPAIIFVTQQGAMQMDWSKWGDCEIIFDEVPEVFSTFQIKAKNHASLLRSHVHVETEDGDCYRLGLTSKGRELASTNDFDDYDSIHYGLILMMAKNNAFVWVKRDGWDNPSDRKMEFFAITSPLNLRAFKAVRMLGDELRRSITAKVWTEKWGVKFQDEDFNKRKRLIPTTARTKIKYFAEHRDSSITRFREGDLPLTAISEYIKNDALNQAVLWTANEKLKDACALPTEDFASPKSHGRNDLQHYERVAWLAAMKASKFEIASLKNVCGMNNQDLTDWREYNALYQFVMRTILRDYNSAVPITVYVFSRKQADYLQSRLGGTVQRVSGVVIDQQPRSLHPDGPMSGAERNKVKSWREKMTKANVSDVRHLPLTKPRAKLSARMIELINATARRYARENGADRAAA